MELILEEDGVGNHNGLSSTVLLDCTCYTDGSLINPAHSYFGLGGFALWWRDRDLCKYPFSNNELDYTIHAPWEGGVGCYGPIPGTFCSSTRTELIPGLMSLSCGFPVKLGADNLNFVRTAQKILADPEFKPKKPWNLMANGDLWQLYQDHVRCLAATGNHGRSVIKLKAHTSLEAVAHGIISFPDREGNGFADALARKGVEHHTLGLVALCNTYVMREKKYLGLLRTIHRMILRVLKSDHDHREKTATRAWATGAKLPTHKVVLHPTLPVSDTINDAQHIRMVQTQAELLQNAHRCTLQIWCFLQLFPVYEVQHPCHGTSWLELFCLFELCGGRLDGDDSNNSAIPKSSLRACLATFKEATKLVVDCCMNPLHQRLFASSKSPLPRLASLGYGSFVPCIRGSIKVPAGLSDRLQIGLLHLRFKTITRARRTAMLNGSISLATTKVSYRGCPAWRGVNVASKEIPEAVRAWRDRPHQSSTSYLPWQYISIGCPRCGASKDATNLQLFGNRKFHSVLCTDCRHSSSSKKWNCECNRPWYSCDVHSFAGFRVPQAQTQLHQTVAASSAKNSQTCPMHSDSDFIKATSNSRDPQLKGIKRPLAVSATSRPRPDNATKRYRTKPRNQSSSCTRGTKRRAQDDLDAIHAFTRMQLAREHPA